MHSHDINHIKVQEPLRFLGTDPLAVLKTENEYFTLKNCMLQFWGAEDGQNFAHIQPPHRQASTIIYHLIIRP